MSRHRAVEILFPGLTHKGHMYAYGEIEAKPSDWLIECAEERETQFHRDQGRDLRICRFVQGEEDDGGVVRRTPVYLGEADDLASDNIPMKVFGDIKEMKGSELRQLVTALGYKKKASNALKIQQLKLLASFLRIL